MNKENLQLVIFDMDGVIINSEPLHDAVYEQIEHELAQGTKVSVENTTGTAAVDVYRRLIAVCPPAEVTPEALATCHFERVWQKMIEMQLGAMDGLQDLLRLIADKGCIYAVASSSPRSFVERCLTSVGMLEGARAVICGDSGFLVKPAPDMFLAALKATGIPAQRAVVIEDSHAGTIAAKRARIRCIGLKNPDSGMQDLSSAGWLANNLSEAARIIATL